MKTFVPALVAALVAALLTAGSFLVFSDPDPSSAPDEGILPPDGDLALVALRVEGAEPAPSELAGGAPSPTVRELEMRVATLESKLAALANLRRPVEDAGEAPESLALPDDPVARDFVLHVLSQKEEADRLAREEEQRRRNEERLLREAERIAQAIGLAGGQTDALYGVLLEDNARREALFETMRAGNFGPESRDAMRQEMQAIQDWRQQALTAKLGADVAQQVLKWQEENGGRGARSPFGGAGRDFGGGGRGGGRGGI
ncbi:MAG: hypothetical protein AB1726_07210 [Planctomycetota bacterium]